MALNAKEPPEQGLEIIRKAIDQLMGQPTYIDRTFAGATPDRFSLASPHPIYVVELTDVAEGRLLSAAKLRGWRYIVLDGEEIVGAANLSVSENEEDLKFSHISHGPFVKNTVEGIGVAESLSEALVDDYELRLLDIPALYVVALWLYGGPDRLIPIPPTIRVLEPYRTYSEEEMTAVLKEPAVSRLQFDETDPEETEPEVLK